jgi:hypothetical protein
MTSADATAMAQHTIRIVISTIGQPSEAAGGTIPGSTVVVLVCGSHH